MKSFVCFMFISCLMSGCVERQPRRPVSQNDAARIRRARDVPRSTLHALSRAEPRDPRSTDAAVPILQPVGRAFKPEIIRVYRAERASGWREGQPLLPLKRIMSHLAHRRHYYDARRYAAKVLAAAIFVDRYVHRQRLRVSRSYPLARIPGAIPPR